MSVVSDALERGIAAAGILTGEHLKLWRELQQPVAVLAPEWNALPGVHLEPPSCRCASWQQLQRPGAVLCSRVALTIVRRGCWLLRVDVLTCCGTHACVCVQSGRRVRGRWSLIYQRRERRQITVSPAQRGTDSPCTAHVPRATKDHTQMSSNLSDRCSLLCLLVRSHLITAGLAWRVRRGGPVSVY